MTVRPLLEVSPIPPSTFESPELTPALRALVTALVDARVEERVRALVQPNAIVPAKRPARPLTVDACLLSLVETNATWTTRGGMPDARMDAIMVELRGADLFVTPSMLSADAARAIAIATVAFGTTDGRHFPPEAWEPLRAAHRAKAVQ